MSAVRLTATVDGWVQGVGFRAWVRGRARELGLVGVVANLPDGRVEVVAEGDRSRCERLVDLLRSPAGPGRVQAVRTDWSAPRGDLVGFATR